MLIDFHTHIFPTAVAPHALSALVAGAKKARNEDILPFADGTRDGLLKLMDEAGVDISVTLPIATKPSQTESINKFSLSVKCDRIEPFGAIHPQNKNYKEILSLLKAQGFKGIKLHPEFQDFYIDSDEAIAILKQAESLGLYTVIHSGADVGFPPPVHCTPERLLRVLKHISGERLILAHMGGFELWEEVDRLLASTSVYYDLAVVAAYLEPTLCERLIENHGADLVLFASDSPWETPKKTLAFLEALRLTDEEKEKIKYRNAEKILGFGENCQK